MALVSFHFPFLHMNCCMKWFTKPKMNISKLRSVNISSRFLIFHKMGVFIYTFLVLATLLNSVKSESKAGVSQAIIVAKQVAGVVGEPVTISCLSGLNNPLELCRWERKPRPPNGKRYVVTLKDGSETTAFGNGNTTEAHQSVYNCNCSYKYSGKGLDKGDCSMTIYNVTDFHFAKWECTLLGKEEHTWSGSLNITKPLSEPYFKNTELLNEIVYNETSPANTDVTCCAEAYDPLLSININILLENPQDVPTNLQRESGSRISMQKESGLSLRGEEACRRSRYLFKPKDNGKRVICVARFMYNSHEYNQTTFHQVNVKYGPILTSEGFVQNMTANNSLLINATFMANPPPDARWFMENDPASGASFEIQKGHLKYKTDIQNIQGDNYFTTLEILDLQPEDYRREFLLKIESAFGKADAHVHLRDPNASPIEEPAQDWVMIIIGVSIIVALVLIAAIVFVCIKQRVNSGKYIPTKVSYSKEDDVD